jgi:enoyl-CoA hydratase
MMGLKLAKLSVNQSLDAQGQRSAVEAAFNLHQLGHSHNQQLFGKLIDPSGVRVIRDGA